MPNRLRNLFSPKPSIRDDKDLVIPAGAEQFNADICYQIKLPDTGGKLDQPSIRVVACEKVLNCRCYLRLQRVHTCGLRRFVRPFPHWALVIVTRHAHSLRPLPSVQGACPRSARRSLYVSRFSPRREASLPSTGFASDVLALASVRRSNHFSAHARVDVAAPSRPRRTTRRSAPSPGARRRWSGWTASTRTLPISPCCPSAGPCSWTSRSGCGATLSCSGGSTTDHAHRPSLLDRPAARRPRSGSAGPSQPGGTVPAGTDVDAALAAGRAAVARPGK